jgi:hypothetical protein
MSDRNTVEMTTQFNVGQTTDTDNAPAHSVILTDKKPEYWQLAVDQWAAHEKIKLMRTTFTSPKGEWTQYGFETSDAARSFCHEMFKGSFDVQAQNIAMKAAGVKLEQAESPIAWASTPAPERTN